VEPDRVAGIWCKLEFLNPSGSTRDRVARYIPDDAEVRGLVRTGDLVVEASSGSTSIAMALAYAQRGLRFLAVMPEGVSNERTLMIRAFGGKIRMTRKARGIAGAIAESERCHPVVAFASDALRHHTTAPPSPKASPAAVSE
jgi:cysteine synthase A